MNSRRSVDFHGVTFTFNVGNIATFKAGTALVSTDQHYSMHNGAARAIGDQGGLAFRAAFEVAFVLNQRDFLVVNTETVASLAFKNLIVIPVRARHRVSIRAIYRVALRAAIDNGHDELVMPLIGCEDSGGLNVSVHRGCRDLKEAVSTFSNFGSLRKIHFIDFSNETMDKLALNFYTLDENDLPDIYGVEQDNGDDNGIQFIQNVPAPPRQLSNDIIAFDGPLPAPISVNVNDVIFLESREIVTNPPVNHDEACEFYTIVDRASLVSSDPSTSANDSMSNLCPICLCDLATTSAGQTTPEDLAEDPAVKLKKCIHMFHRVCIEACFKNKKQCPMCMRLYASSVGSQPPNGTMKVESVRGRVPGHPKAKGWFKIKYVLSSGIQTAQHVRPGEWHSGTTRRAWLPDDEGGREVLGLLRRAFDKRHIFTIGDSLTTGVLNTPVWVIHHKTSQHGGPDNYGFPDPDYYNRVKAELENVGITTDLPEE